LKDKRYARKTILKLASFSVPKKSKVKKRINYSERLLPIYFDYYTPQLCCGWDRPMQQWGIVKQCFRFRHTPKLQSASAFMPRSSAAVGSAGATFDFLSVRIRVIREIRVPLQYYS
jgi:hypothetical protein